MSTTDSIGTVPEWGHDALAPEPGSSQELKTKLMAAAVKQIMPGTKVIGVEPSDSDVLNRSLLSGHRVSLPEPGHFVDGAAVAQIGPEVFRICNELVDDLVTVSNDEICAAVRDCFEDSRAMLEPAGAISIAGAKKYIASLPTRADGSKEHYP